MKKIISLYHQHERRLSLAALIFGFILDSLTLRRVDLLVENLAFMSYLFVVLASIFIIYFYERKSNRGTFFSYVYEFAPLPMQFAFGALFSGFVVFYFRSSSFFISWPFLVVLASLLIGNEFFRARYTRTSFHLSLFYVAFFSYLVFAVPVLVKRIGADIFLLSGFVSIVGMFLLMSALSRIAPSRMREVRVSATRSILIIFFVMNILYFFNIIPPIPLSLQEVEIARFVEKTSAGRYRLVKENQGFFEKFLLREIVSVPKGSGLYFYSSVFAPTSLETDIVHQWQYFDAETNKWKSDLRILFSIVGGRDGGYRGYTRKDSISSGLWRVLVETSRGQVLGRKTFRVIFTDTPAAFEVVER